MAALSGPASTMKVLLGEATADFFTKRNAVLRQGHGAEDPFESCIHVHTYWHMYDVGDALCATDRLFPMDGRTVETCGRPPAMCGRRSHHIAWAAQH